ncbi:MAG: ATP-binding cassette domain-containing protein [Phycisphaeraceae bacterium]|nr:ATP-binding cassette domain-containing protein [Phycisphaeraceae bacterium]
MPLSEPTDTPALSVRGLRFRYPGAALDLLNIPEFQLAPAEQALLTGGSGVGKSTLLQIIAGLIEPTGGTVAVAGRDIHAMQPGARDTFRGRRIGMIFQTFHLLAGFSALENVMLALMFSDLPRREHRDRARALLAALGLGEREMSAEPDALSVGQQQRVAVARALACRPALVLADEPTASLDPANTGAAMDLIQRACRDERAALLCVSHDPAMAARFSRVVPLHANPAAAGAGA